MALLSFEFKLNHIFFFLIFIVYCIRHYIQTFNSFSENEKKAHMKIFNIYIYTISNLFSSIFFCIVRKRSKTKKKKLERDSGNKSKIFNKESSKTIKTLDIELIYEKSSPVSRSKLLIRTLIVAITDLIAQYSLFIFYIYYDIKKVQLDIVLIFNILSIYIFSKLILKTYYYKHHHLSLLINLIGILLISITDIIILYEVWNKDLIYFLFVDIFSNICYSLEDVIGKKALMEEFLSPYSLLIYKGLYELILLFIASIPFFFIKIDESNIFSVFIRKMNSFGNILYIFLLMIINFFYTLLIWIIIDIFSPNHLAMAMCVEGILDKLDLLIFNFDKFKNNIFISIYGIVIYFILTLGTLIHNEILIINSCGLNEYTNKNIDIKGVEDFQHATGRRGTNSTIIFDDNQENKDINDKMDNKEIILNELSMIPPQEKDS